MNRCQTSSCRTIRIGFVLLTGLMWFQLLDPLSVKGQKRDTTYQEAYLEFAYSGLVSDVVTAQYDGTQFYISLTEVFDLLRIDYRFDREQQRVSGFYLNQDQEYRIDLKSLVVRIGGEAYSVSPSDYVLTELDLFLAPGLFSRVFGLNFTPSMRNLNLTLQTPQAMPVEEQAMREQQRARTGGRTHLRRPDAPLIDADEFSWFDAGVFDYTMGTNVNESDIEGRFNLQYGGLLLGGDVRGSMRGTYGSRGMSMYPSSGAWRLAVDKPYLTQIRAGQLSSTGLRQGRYTGVRVTNDPIRVQRTYGSYQVEGRTEPEWEVELYVNGQLVEYTRADAQGRYTFDVPLSYGSTQITIRKYGPTGQMEEENRRVQVPFTFVPEGDVYYSLEAGRSRSPDVYAAQSHASIGLTNWLTTQTGVDFVVNHPGEGRSAARYYNKLSARLGGSYIISVHAAPDVRYQATLNANYASQTSFQLSYGYNYEDEVFNRFNQEEEVGVRGTLPVNLPYIPLLVRFDGTRRKLSASRYSYRLNPSATLRLPGSSRLSVTYRGQANQADSEWILQGGSVRGDLSYVFPPFSGPLSPLRRLRVSTRTDYDLQRDQMRSVSLDVSRRLFNIGQFRFSVTHNVHSGFTTGNFRMTFDLPYVRTSTSARYNRSQVRFSQDINGALAFDSRYRRLNFNRRGWTGRAGVAIRMFVDANGNDRYDEGERLIEDAEVQFRRAQRTDGTERGIVRATNLQPYDRYNVSVDQSTIPNPLWVPKREEFSFIARPNKYTPVDIPFYVAGVIEGSVLRVADSTKRSVPGLDVIVRGVDSDFRKKIDVFNEGDFYDYTIPPGTYTIFVDSTQRNTLNVRSEPESRQFTIEHTEEGDYVSDLTFLLHPLQPAETDEPEAPEEEEAEPTPPIAEDISAEEEPSGQPASEAAVEEESAMSYAVQLNAFTTYRRAEEFVSHSEVLFDRPMRIRYKPEVDMFAVEVNHFTVRRNAVELLENIENRPYMSDAFLVSKSRPVREVQFALQVGAFFNEENARYRAQRIRQQLQDNLTVTVHHDAEQDLYKVLVNPTLDREAVEELRAQFANMEGFREAFVTTIRTTAGFEEE